MDTTAADTSIIKTGETLSICKQRPWRWKSRIGCVKPSNTDRVINQCGWTLDYKSITTMIKQYRNY